MFLFEKNFEVQRKPFYFFTINNALDEELAKELENKYHNPNVKIWKRFLKHHVQRIEEITNLLDRSFNLPNEKLNYEINFPCWPPNNGSIIRDWHIDGPSKKYQIIYYLGESDNLGHTELAEDNQGTNTLKIPFEHNRLLVFFSNNNSSYGPKSWHRFFSKKQTHRKTLNIPLTYKNIT